MSALFLIGMRISAAANTTPAVIQYVGSVSINPSHDAIVMADWYQRFGIPTQKMGDGYYGMFQTVAGPFFFGIHARDPKAPVRSSGSVAVVFRVSDYDSYVANAANSKILPQSTESDSTGRFAHFFDPDGNEVTIWGN
jgi:predicted enzyme related to lactoylglutathione lyase